MPRGDQGVLASSRNPLGSVPRDSTASAMYRRRRLPGSALFAEVGNNFVTGDRLHLPAFQIVITAIEHFASRRKLSDVSGHRVLDQFVGRTPGFDRQLVNLGLQIWRKMYFHGSKPTGKPAAWQRRLNHPAKPFQHNCAPSITSTIESANRRGREGIREASIDPVSQPATAGANVRGEFPVAGRDRTRPAQNGGEDGAPEAGADQDRRRGVRDLSGLSWKESGLQR